MHRTATAAADPPPAAEPAPMPWSGHAAGAAHAYDGAWQALRALALWRDNIVALVARNCGSTDPAAIRAGLAESFRPRTHDLDAGSLALHELLLDQLAAAAGPAVAARLEAEALERERPAEARRRAEARAEAERRAAEDEAFTRRQREDAQYAEWLARRQGA
jgi:hypothetical protein